MKKIILIALLVSVSACTARTQEIECMPLGGISKTTETTYSFNGSTEKTEYGFDVDACGENRD